MTARDLSPANQTPEEDAAPPLAKPYRGADVRRRYRLRICVLLAVMLFMMTLSAPERTRTYEESQPDNCSSEEVVSCFDFPYTYHAPIFVDKDVDFENGPWVGDGSALSPYTISGFFFNTPYVAIKISKTTVHYNISNCLFLGGVATRGIEISQSYNGIIEDSKFQGIKIGVNITKSEDMFVYNSTFSNSEIGSYFEQVVNASVVSSTFSDLDSGIYSIQTEVLRIESGSFQNNQYSIQIDNGDAIHITSCNIDGGNIGILVGDIGDMQFKQLNFTDLQYAIFISTSENFTIEDAKPDSCTYGIYVSYSNDFRILSSEMTASTYGIYISNVETFNITGNLISASTYDGIIIRKSSDGFIIDNIVQKNNRYGINLIASSEITVYGNEIGWNDEANAIDSIGTLNYMPTNYWDDNLSRGNGYSDFMGTKEYTISGTVQSVDRYPSNIL